MISAHLKGVVNVAFYVVGAKNRRNKKEGEKLYSYSLVPIFSYSSFLFVFFNHGIKLPCNLGERIIKFLPHL